MRTRVPEAMPRLSNSYWPYRLPTSWEATTQGVPVSLSRLVCSTSLTYWAEAPTRHGPLRQMKVVLSFHSGRPFWAMSWLESGRGVRALMVPASRAAYSWSMMSPGSRE